MNFQKFEWHDDIRSWTALRHPSTLLFVQNNSLSIMWNMFQVELESFLADVEHFFDTQQCKCLQSIRVDHLHLH